MALTERTVRDAKPGPKTYIVWDSQVRGLGLRVAPGGTKAYILNYRTPEGRERRATLARASEIGLKDVRERAGAELVSIRAGKADPLDRRKKARAAPTVAEGVERFFREYAPRRIEDGRMKERTAKEYARQWALTNSEDSAFGKMRIEKVTRQDVERAIIKRAPMQRNRVLAFLSRLFTYFESIEYRPQHSNPCRYVEKARENVRDRVLSPAELKELATALDTERESAPAATASVAVAALTGLRISEVLAMQWEHIDMDTGRVLLPETKTGRRWHDLPDAALAVIGSLPRLNGYIFTTGLKDCNAPITYKTASGAFRRARKAAGLEDVRLHDLRRTFATNAAAAGLSALQLQHLLGWKQAAMPARYVNLAGEATRESRRALGAQIADMMQPG